MSQPLNLYASRILQESPLVIWPIDEKADYYNFIQENRRAATTSLGWSITGATSSKLEEQLGTEPFSESSTTRFVADSSDGLVVIESPVLTSFSALDKYLATYSVSSFLLFSQNVVSSVSIGVRYQDPFAGTTDIVKEFPVFVSGSWINIAETFDIPHDFTYDIKMVIKVKYDKDSPLTFYTNGLSFGQWSEECSATSLGTDISYLPSKIYGFPEGKKGIRIYGAGESDQDAFIVVDGNNKINSRSNGLPLVYGAQSASFIEQADSGLPSIIFPSNGFMMDYAKYTNLSVEFWAKINNTLQDPFRIFGPIGSNDGVYVEGPFIKLQVGNKIGTHSVLEWGRPMLIHIVLQQDSAQLLINGSKVIDIEVDKKNTNFSQRVIDGKSADWLGIYGSESIEPLEIDCVSIFPYSVSTEVAKKRFVYGQGVIVPDALNTAYSGKTVSFDYEFAQYSQNFSYPTKASWNKGRSQNLVVDADKIHLPQYAKPTMVLGQVTETQLMTALASHQNDLSGLFFSFKPDNSINPSGSYLSFDKINVGSKTTKGFYVSAKASSSNNGQTVFILRDNLSTSYLEAKILDNNVSYIFNSSGTQTTLFESPIVQGEILNIGLDFDKVASYFGGALRTFISNSSNISVHVGGSYGKQTFTGKIFSISFLNEDNLYEVRDAFSDIGFVWEYNNQVAEAIISGGTALDVVTQIADAGTNLYTQSFLDYLYDGGSPNGYAQVILAPYISAYTLKTFKDNDICTLDIASTGSWSDYIPLSYFSKPYKDQAGIVQNGVDSIQINVSYPAPDIFEKVETTGDVDEWTYAALKNKFALPTQKKYSDLDNHLYTGYVDYESLRINTEFYYRYNTDRSLVKTFIYFKTIDSAVASSPTYYTEKISAPKSRVVSPGEEWINTKYEVVNNTVVFMPPNVDVDKVALCFEVQFKVNGTEHNPIYINNLSFASQTFDKTAAKEIGTKFGTGVYPFEKDGFYYNYKGKNPITITKQSTPHLYLNKSNGISVIGDFDPRVQRGIYVPINKEKSSNYKVAAINSFLLYDYDFFPYSPQEIFSIQSNNEEIVFYVQAIHPEGTRGKIFAINKSTGQVENGISYFMNGKLVNKPVLTVKQWSCIGIVFASYINVSGHEGSIKITGPISFDNLSMYAANRLQQVQVTTERSWARVESPVIGDVDWLFWTPYIWNEVLIMSSRSFYGINPEDIYQLYTGTNRIIVDDGQKIRTRYYQYRLMNTASAVTSVVTPV
jgi:hypothetical protein